VRRKIQLVYSDENKQKTQRTIHPLALFFFNPVWLQAGWIEEKRQDFRNFRLDRIQQLSLTDNYFAGEPHKNLAAYLTDVESCQH